MDKQAVIRRVRIAVSVIFGVLTVALCVLWVRSYTWHDRVRGPWFNSGGMTVSSMIGQLSFIRDVRPWPRKTQAMRIPDGLAKPWRQKWFWGSFSMATVISVPHGFPVFVLSVFAMIPWVLVHRFSLRTMLIATTLVAVVLGLVCYADR